MKRAIPHGFSIVVLHDPGEQTSGLTDDDVSQANISCTAGYPSADPNHQTDLNRWKSRQHLLGNDSGRCQAIPSAGKACYHDFVVANLAEVVCVVVTFRLGERGMAGVEHRNRGGLLEGESADPADFVGIVV